MLIIKMEYKVRNFRFPLNGRDVTMWRLYVFYNRPITNAC